MLVSLGIHRTMFWIELFRSACCPCPVQHRSLPKQNRRKLTIPNECYFGAPTPDSPEQAICILWFKVPCASILSYFTDNACMHMINRCTFTAHAPTLYSGLLIFVRIHIYIYIYIYVYMYIYTPAHIVSIVRVSMGTAMLACPRVNGIALLAPSAFFFFEHL